MKSVACRIEIEGVVQGVGFRPFVYQQAVALGIAGRVFNTTSGVVIEVQGDEDAMDQFLDAVKHRHPPLARISALRLEPLKLFEATGFTIDQSAADPVARAQITPDCHLCDDCLRELLDPHDRRYRYPFITCTNCGPRFTIIIGTPYDRPLTTMADFPLCDACRTEYEDPTSRRFHAQPNACPDCGPALSLLDAEGRAIEGDPVAAAAEQLRQGRVIAVKGVGGYHLVVDATNDAAVQLLRERKLRDEKPFALMVPDLAAAYELAEVDATEEQILTGVERPIVLLRRREAAPLGTGNTPLSDGIAPGNRFFGIMLPYTPLHHLLFAEGFRALVMTSANFSDEPILYTDSEAREGLADVADAFLMHNRRIHMRTDDSIVRIMAERPVLLRRARGYVPRSMPLGANLPPVLALGGDIKNLFCLVREEQAFLSQHIGDLKNSAVIESLRNSIRHLQGLIGTEPQLIAHDLHPDYFSTRFAEEEYPHLPRFAIQHHHAHLASCMAEHRLEGEVIGVIFDGLGYGDDGTIWGGEFLIGGYQGCRRFAHLAPLRMPGGDAATKEPWRMAVSALVAAGVDPADWPGTLGHLSDMERNLTTQMVQRGLNAPLTSSCGRLFDAVSALLGIKQKIAFEGQAALMLEMAITEEEGRAYPFELVDCEGALQIDFAPAIRALVADMTAGKAPGIVSRSFHDGVADAVLAVSLRAREVTGETRVVLSGGVFQNRYLTEAVAARLRPAGFDLYLHSLVPPNDGGIALGQAMIAAAQFSQHSPNR